MYSLLWFLRKTSGSWWWGISFLQVPFSRWTIILALYLAVMQSGCTCLDRLAADAFGLFNLSEAVFLRHCQLNGKKPIKTHVLQIFVNPFFSQCCGMGARARESREWLLPICLGRVSPFCITVKWRVNYYYCYFYLHC